MNNLLLFFLICLPFSAFLIPRLDIWHAQGYYAQTAILIFYCYHLYKKNKPFAILFGWVGLLTSYLFINVQIQTKQLPILVFLPFFNFLCIVILFDVLTTYVNKEFFNKFIKYFSIPFLIILVYSVVQQLGLDQFYRSIDLSLRTVNNNEVVGIIGNPMHNSHFIVICLPVLFMFKGWVRKLLILFTLFVILLTRSSSGFILALVVILFGQLFLKIFNWKEIILGIILGLIVGVLKFHSLDDAIKHFTFSSGRFEVWKNYIPVFIKKPLTGWGLGVINELSLQKQFFNWRHLHLEYYHFAVELGLIAVGIAFWGIVDYFRKFKSAVKDDVTVVMASMFLGFLLTSLFGYPMHLWILSVLGITAYSYLYIGVDDGVKHVIRDKK